MRSTHFEEHDQHGEMPVRLKLERDAQLEQKPIKNASKPKAKAAAASR